MASEEVKTNTKKKRKKIVIIVISIVASALVLAVAIPFTILGIRTASLKSNYDYLRSDTNYNDKVEISHIELVEQHVSCGYATIEMISSFYGNKVTEDELDARNPSVSTSSSNGFLKEINKCIPTKTFEMHSYLKNDELLKEIHDSIKNDNPVAIEWAAKYEGEWTFHFSVISGLDLTSDNVTILNPYGYIENITVDEFIDRASFNAYKNIPLFLYFGFAFGAFDKNTIFYIK